MSQPGRSQSHSLPVSAAERLDEACDQFETAWRTGPRPQIEQFFEHAAEPLRSVLIRELVALDLFYRKRLGERPAPEQYVGRFPAHAAAIQAEFAQHERSLTTAGSKRKPQAVSAKPMSRASQSQPAPSATGSGLAEFVLSELGNAPLPKAAPATRTSKHKLRSRQRVRSVLVPLCACLVFAVLIAGTLASRRVIVRWFGLSDGIPGEEGHAPAGSVGSSSSGVAATEMQAGQLATESSEPGFDVLPPGAPPVPGRTLRKMLVVGEDQGMFASLEEAMQVAIPGDIIELRTNGPLLVAGAEMRLKQRVKDALLTIRAGKGYEPVLTGPPDHPWLTMVNTNVKIVGLHFTRAVLGADSGSVLFEHCTFTRGGLSAANSKGRGNPIEIVLKRCFARGAKISCYGPSISVLLSDSAFAGAQHYLIDMPLRDDQVVRIDQSTLFQCSLLNLGTADTWPRVPLSFQMQRSVFGLIYCCPTLVDLQLPPTSPAHDFGQAHEALRRGFREFRAAENFANYWEGWAWVGTVGSSNPFWVRDAVFPDLPTNDGTIAFGRRIEEARFLVHGKGDVAAGQWLVHSAVPLDLAVRSTGPLGHRLREGAHYGADLARLPVPPPATLAMETNRVADVTYLEAEQLTVLERSDPFPVYPQEPHELGNWLPGEALLVCKTSKPGQWIELEVPVPRVDQYELHLRLNGGPTCGKVRCYINGHPAGEVDLHAPDPSATPLLDLGQFELSAGHAVLRIETAAKDPEPAESHYEFGVDYVSLRPVTAP